MNIVLVSVQIDVLTVYTVHTYRVTVHITHNTHYTQLSQLLFSLLPDFIQVKKLSQQNY